MKLKKFIMPIIAITIFIIIYFIALPLYSSLTAPNQIYKDFEKGLTNLGIAYQKIEESANEYGAKKAYSYVANEKKVILYIFSKDSDIYKKGKEEGYITSKEHPESVLYGFFVNNCVLFMEAGFPNDEQVLNLFSSISMDYADKIS